MLMQIDDSFISLEFNLNTYKILDLGKQLNYSCATSVKVGFFSIPKAIFQTCDFIPIKQSYFITS